MTITYRQGDILSAPEQIIVVPVNCVGVMGAGLAKAAAAKWPRMRDGYQMVCKYGGLEPGGWWIWTGEPQWVLTFATKDHWNAPSRLEWIDTGLRKLVRQTSAPGEHPSIAFPALGCGLGGLHWPEVRDVMEHHLADYKGAVAIYAPGYIPGQRTSA